MTREDDPNGLTPDISKEELAWAAANLPLVRRWVSGQRFLREALIYAFVLGLAAHAGGYMLEAAATGEPVRLLADLLRTLGTTVWTGVILVVFVQILPETRQRWAARRLAAYEAALREQRRSGQ